MDNNTYLRSNIHKYQEKSHVTNRFLSRNFDTFHLCDTER